MAHAQFPKIIGVNQLLDETAMVVEDDMFVRESVNTDIDAEGNVSLRKGASLQVSGSGYHSLFSSSRGWLMMCHREQLGVYDPATTTFTPLVSMDDNYRVSYAEANGNLYVSSPSFSCMFTIGSSDPKPVGVPLPSVEPEFSALSSGDMEEGTYGIAYTLLNPDGEESGLSEIQTLDIPAGGGVQGTLFTSYVGYSYRVYMTTANGDTLRQATEFEADTATIQILVPEEGRLAETQGLEPLHKGHIIRAFNSRMLVADSNTLYFSEAFRPHLARPDGFVSMTGLITMVEPVEGGVYVGDSRGVRFYKGEDPTAWTVMEITPTPVIFGTSITVPGSFFQGEITSANEVAVWLSTEGYVLGLPEGEIIRLNSDQLKLPKYIQGCVALNLSDGRKQLVTPVNSNVLADANVALDSTTI